MNLNENENDCNYDYDILRELNFDDSNVLIHLVNKITRCNYISLLEVNNFNFFLCLHKVLLILNKSCTIITDNSIKADNKSTIDAIKIFITIEIFKIKYFSLESIYNKNQSKIDNPNFNELCYNIYKIIEEDNTGINLKTLDLFTNIFFSEYLTYPNQITFEKYLNLMLLDNLVVDKINFDNFLKYFNPLVYFYLIKDKFTELFETIDFEIKNKILSADLSICLKKLMRNLNEKESLANNIYIITINNFLKMVNTDQVFIQKNEFYLTLMKSLL